VTGNARRVLVTGAAGFIGSHLVTALEAAGDDVVAVDSLVVPPLLPPRPDLRHSCVTELTLDDLEGVDAVVHLASWREVATSFDHPIRQLDNVTATLHLLELARGARVPRTVVASTCEVYGAADVIPTPEGAPLGPRSPYAISKAMMEFACDVYRHDGVPISVARLFNVYGPGNRADTVVAAFCASALRDGVVRVEGDGHQRRDYSHVSQTVAALAALLDTPDTIDVVNLGTGTSWSVLDIGRIVTDLVPGTRVEWTASRPKEIPEFRADTTLLHATLGRGRPVDFGEGVGECLRWWSDRLESSEVENARAVDNAEDVR
jgi:nucleoside-diphosphate-sugar epimerase